MLAEIARDKVKQIQAQSDLASACNREAKKEENEKLRAESEQALLAEDTAKDAKSNADQVKHQRSSLAFANLQRLQEKCEEGEAKTIKEMTTAATFQVLVEDDFLMQKPPKAEAPAVAAPAAAPAVAAVTLDALTDLESCGLAA